jgi:hypothetical protein
LTSAAVVKQLDDVEREFMDQHSATTTVKASVVVLIENTSGRWEVRAAFQFVSAR